MLRASGRQKYERVCEAEASRKAGVGIDAAPGCGARTSRIAVVFFFAELDMAQSAEMLGSTLRLRSKRARCGLRSP